MASIRLRAAQVAIFVLAALAAAPTFAQGSFTNWETPHVSPLDVTPGGQTLLAVNTADNRLELFDLSGPQPRWTASAPVGLDPVSVAAQSDSVAWVVNHVSDSISLVDLVSLNVFYTIKTPDEPTDVVFAAGRAFVTCSQVNQVLVYDPANLAAAPLVLNIAGEDPRALAVSPDGSKVYAAIFESGNRTTAIERATVDLASGPYGGQNPPPNSGSAFNPPIRAGLPTPPRVAHILKRNATNTGWTDDNNRAWSSTLVPWNVHDHDLAVIDAASLNVGYVTGLMNLCMALTVRPDGRVIVVGTDATNHVRFEPNVAGRFLHVVAAIVNDANPALNQTVDLNPHLAGAYAAGLPSVPQNQRDLSISDPRGVAWRGDGSAGYVTGMGTNNLLKIDAGGAVLARIGVGAGPTGVQIDDARGRAYVLNKFDATLSVIDTSSDAEIARVGFYDPTPAVIRDGRPFLYDAHRTSGLGLTACAACHIDGRMDQLAWDLGNPAGSVKPFNQQCQLPGSCENWHPMKGPMTTQTLQGIVDVGPLHWRGDRESLTAFNPAFESLLGDDAQLTAGEMLAFENFIATIQFPPNPNRNIDNSLRSLLVDGNPINGESLYLNARIDGGLITCNQCHAVPAGTNGQITPAVALQAAQSMKIPQLRNLYEKTGFAKSSTNNNRGFAFTHDGSIDSLFNFLSLSVFNFPAGATGQQQRRDIAAFLMSFSVDTHAGIGVQVTLDGTNNNDAAVLNLLNTMVGLADLGEVGLVVKGSQPDGVGGPSLARGYAYQGGGVFQSDRAAQTVDWNVLRSAAAPGHELTWTMVPLTSAARIGVDRDGDNFLDRDELDGCGDPADPLVGPGDALAGDANCDRAVDNGDIDYFVAALLGDESAYVAGGGSSSCWARQRCWGDLNEDGFIDNGDIDAFVELLLG